MPVTELQNPAHPMAIVCPRSNGLDLRISAASARSAPGPHLLVPASLTLGLTGQPVPPPQSLTPLVRLSMLARTRARA